MTSSPVPPGVDPCTVPAAVPPDGQLPNFVNPASLSTATIVISVVMTAWALAFVAVRITVNRRKLSWSDYFMAIGMVFDIAYTAIFTSRSKYNRHLWDVPFCWLTPTYIQINFANAILIGPALYFSKSSIFLLYRQFFSVKKSMKIAVYIGLVVTFLTYFPQIPIAIRYDSPLGGESWAGIITNDDHTTVYWSVVSAALAVALDIYIFVLPLPTLAALQMSLELRVQLIAVFSTALMGVIASVVSLVYRVKLLEESDPTWQQAAVGIAVVVENNVAIIVGSMPAVATFMRVHVSGSSICKTWRSKIRRPTSSDGYSWRDSRPSFRRPDLATFGSPHVQTPGSYELSRPTATAARVISDQHDLLYSVPTAESHRAYAQPSSTDRLV